MKDQSIIIAVAKLDGYKDYHQKGGTLGSVWEGYDTNDKFVIFEDLPHYPTSHDAIIPVIEKAFNTEQMNVSLFIDELRQYYGIQGSLSPMFTLFIPPKQLCIALLKATEKWEK